MLSGEPLVVQNELWEDLVVVMDLKCRFFSHAGDCPAGKIGWIHFADLLAKSKAH